MRWLFSSSPFVVRMRHHKKRQRNASTSRSALCSWPKRDALACVGLCRAAETWLKGCFAGSLPFRVLDLYICFCPSCALQISSSSFLRCGSCVLVWFCPWELALRLALLLPNPAAEGVYTGDGFPLPEDSTRETTRRKLTSSENKRYILASLVRLSPDMRKTAGPPASGKKTWRPWLSFGHFIMAAVKSFPSSHDNKNAGYR